MRRFACGTRRATCPGCGRRVKLIHDYCADDDRYADHSCERSGQLRDRVAERAKENR